MTNEHASASVAATSLRENGEVWSAQAHQSLSVNTEGQRVHTGVVGDSMSGKESDSEDGRSVGIRPRCEVRPTEVRAAIVVQASRVENQAGKTGHAERSRLITDGAKGGRKWNHQLEPVLSGKEPRLLIELKRFGQKRLKTGKLCCDVTGHMSATGYSCDCVDKLMPPSDVRFARIESAKP